MSEGWEKLEVARLHFWEGFLCQAMAAAQVEACFEHLQLQKCDMSLQPSENMCVCV
jgi:hypothetical protein